MRRVVATVVLALALGAAVKVGMVIFTTPANPAPAQPEPSTGDLVYRQGSYSLRLTEERCDHEELAAAVATGDGIGDAKAAIVMMGATRRAACWAPTIGGKYVVRDYRDVDGGLNPDGVLLQDWFKREPRT